MARRTSAASRKGHGDPLASAALQARRAKDPRSQRSKQVVLDAAVALFEEEGYAGFSVNAIVRRTGIAKTTIYRHWQTQSHLLVDVISRLSEGYKVPDCGNLRDDLIQHFVQSSGSIFNDKKQSALLSVPALIHTAEHEAGIGLMVDFVVSKAFSALRLMLERGRDRGEVRADCDIEKMVQILFGGMFVPRSFLNQDSTQQDIVTIIDLILDGISPAEAPRPAF